MKSTKNVKSMKRKTGIIISAIMMCFIFSSCYDLREIDQMAYVMAFGIDKGKTNDLKITLQFAVPTKSTGGESGGDGGGQGSGGGEFINITTFEAPSIHAGLNIANTYISKEVNFSHAKLVVFSEELAREGIQRYVHAILRGRELRSDMYIAVSRDSAEEYIRNVTPTLELNPAKYYEMSLEAYKYTAFTGDTRLINFYLQGECTCRQAIATLVGVNKYEKPDEFTNEKSTYKEKGRERPFEGDFKAGDIPKVYEIKSEIMGIAAFDGDKMVGEFDGEEAMFHMMMEGSFKQSYISFPDPIQKEYLIVLELRQGRKPDCHVELIDGKPKIDITVTLEADIVSIQSGINYESVENVSILENAAMEFLKDGMLRFLEKTRELGVDICGFGTRQKMKYLFWDDWMKVQWLKIYKDSSFNLKVNLYKRRPGLMIRTTPARSTRE